MTGQAIARYQITSKLGHGGRGAVNPENQGIN
jgi:hypothetical protein